MKDTKKLTVDEFNKESGLRKKAMSLKIIAIVGGWHRIHKKEIYRVTFKNKSIGEYFVDRRGRQSMGMPMLTIILPFYRTSDVKNSNFVKNKIYD